MRKDTVEGYFLEEAASGKPDRLTSEVKVVEVVVNGLVERLLGAELHPAGKQDIPFSTSQNRVFPE